jgi:hypothetical protein
MYAAAKELATPHCTQFNGNLRRSLHTADSVRLAPA